MQDFTVWSSVHMGLQGRICNPRESAYVLPGAHMCSLIIIFHFLQKPKSMHLLIDFRVKRLLFAGLDKGTSVITLTTTTTAEMFPNLFQFNFVSLQFKGIRTGFRV